MRRHGVLHGAQARRDFARRWSLALGADNLFDRYPSSGDLYRAVGYEFVEFSPVDVIGAQWYLRLQARFD